MPVLTTVAKTRGKAKVKISEKRKQVKAMFEKMKSEDLDVTIILIQELIQELIPNGLMAAKEEMEKEIQRLTGERYKHGKENVSWGSQPGSIYLRNQKIPIDVSRGLFYICRIFQRGNRL